MNNVGSKTLFNPVIEIGACSDDSSLHHQSLILNLIYVKSDVGVGQRGTSHMFVCGWGWANGISASIRYNTQSITGTNMPNTHIC